MKKTLFLTSVAALMLSSCASDEVVSNVEMTEGGPAPMEFNFKVGNVGRAGVTDLNERYNEFGVFAIKANGQSDIDYTLTAGNVVMNDYLVGFYGDNQGYAPAIGQNLYGTTWYYEGLGNADAGFNFVGTGKAETSRQANQYLKYWDLSKTNTYFYAFTPYSANAKLAVEGTGADKVTTLTFPTIKMDPYDRTDYMYAYTVCKNSDYATGNETKDDIEKNNFKKVNLQFTRIMAGMRMAFYSAIEGYDVYLVDLAADYPGVYAVPAELKGDKYELGSYVNQATPVVTFKEGSESFAYTNPQTSQTNIMCPIGCFDSIDSFYKTNYDGAAKEVLMGGSYSERIFGHVCNVIPSTTNTGFTLNVSLKLKAKDTQEVIYIKSAKVFVPAQYVNWNMNTLYTYTFRITKTVPGTTDPDPDPEPDPEPDPDPALVPIVFEGVTVTDMTTEDDKEWDVNPGLDGPHGHEQHMTLDQTTLTLAVGTTAKLTATLGNTNTTKVVWSTDKADVATVAEDGTVTAVAAGTATIKAVCGVDVAKCVVTVE